MAGPVQPRRAPGGVAEKPPCPTSLAGFVDSLEQRVAELAGPLHLDADDMARAVPGSDEPPD